MLTCVLSINNGSCGHHREAAIPHCDFATTRSWPTRRRCITPSVLWHESSNARWRRRPISNHANRIHHAARPLAGRPAVVALCRDLPSYSERADRTTVTRCVCSQSALIASDSNAMNWTRRDESTTAARRCLRETVRTPRSRSVITIPH